MVFESCKTPDLIDLDFRVMHNAIFTNEKLYRIGKIDSGLCKLCKQGSEDIQRLFLKCPELKDFYDYVVLQVVILLQHCDNQFLNILNVDEILLLGFPWMKKRVNVYFLNFFLSTYRYCVFKRRNLYNFDSSKVLLKSFFYSLKNLISYFHFHFKSTPNESVFHKRFLDDNPIVHESNNMLVFLI